MTTFFWPYDGNTVAIAGSFNEWKQHPLTKGPNGFFTTIQLPPGTYQYKFIVDGRRWCYDVMRAVTADDNGNRNNTVVVGGGGKQPQHPPVQQHHVQKQPKKEKQEKPADTEDADDAPKGKKGKQPKQQKQKKQKEEDEEEKEPEEDEAAHKKRVGDIAKTIISTVKSYAPPFYVGDVDCKDSVEDVLDVAQQFQTELPSIGCMFLSGGLHSFIVVALVPSEKTSSITATEWVSAALEVVPNAPTPTGSDTLAQAVVAADPEKGIFPIKLKDLSRGPTFALMRKKGLVQEEESEDEMFFLDE